MDRQLNNHQPVEALALSISLLLELGNFSQDTKDTVTTSLPDLSLDELELLVKKLEAEAVNQETSEIDDELANKLQEINTALEKSQSEVDRKTAEAINELADSL
jgi:hypothetical protein